MRSTIYQIRHNVPGKETISNVIVTRNMETVFTCYLMELPWEFNKSNISCIPCGRYTLKKVRSSPSFSYEHFEVINVPGRTGIKWHIANYVNQLRGCGAPGMSLADINKDGLMDVVSSTTALNKLIEILPNETRLIILKG